MSLQVGKPFRMTKKTKIYLAIYHFFDRIGRLGQWFINHCDFEDQLVKLHPPVRLIRPNPPKTMQNLGFKPKTAYEKKLWDKGRTED